jgi:hypothetical protein
MSDREPRADGMRRTRWLIRAEFAVAIGALVVIGLALGLSTIIAPKCLCPMFAEPPEPTLLRQLFPWVGPVGIVVGFAAMFRLSRIDPESGDRTWRYRESSRRP